MSDENPSIFDREYTAEELAQELRKALAELRWTPVELMDRMVSLGDYRSSKTILRGINRALNGEIKASGELIALVNQSVRFKRRLLRNYRDTAWTQLGDGSHTTQIEGFTITLSPQTKGRWRVNLVHVDGYSPPWPRWQDDLEAAKDMALVTLDNAQNFLLELAEERGAR